MKVLLVSVNRERNPYPVFPLGLSYLAAPLTAAGHHLSALDLCFAPDPEEAVDAALAGFAPDVVVLSLRNIDNVTWPGTRFYLEGVTRVALRCRGRAIVIIGGSGFSLLPTEVMNATGADFGVVGEGEEILPRLLELIARGGDTAGLPGVLTAGAATWSPSLPVGAIGTPDRQLFSVERYHREGGMANLQTKRGCPFACVYCTYPFLEGNRVRLRPVDDIIREIGELTAQHGVDYLYFVDDIFNYPPEFAEELCRRMTAAGLRVNWSAFINPQFISPSLIEAMAAAGCDAVEFGTDTGSPAMLASLGKSFTVDDIRESSRLCREAGLDFAHYVLFGGPGETEETVLETFALMDEVAPTAVIAMTGIRIFPGTPLHRWAIKEGVVAADASLLEPVFYISPEVQDTLCATVTAEALARTNWVAPGLELNMSDTMLDALRLFPVRGPLWKLMKRLGRSRVRPLGTPR